MTVYKITGEAQYEPDKTENIVNADKFATRDKYAAFLDGNNGDPTIEGSGTGSILVVKDSYANSFIPYLTENYAKIGVVEYPAITSAASTRRSRKRAMTKCWCSTTSRPSSATRI